MNSEINQVYIENILLSINSAIEECKKPFVFKTLIIDLNTDTAYEEELPIVPQKGARFENYKRIAEVIYFPAILEEESETNIERQFMDFFVEIGVFLDTENSCINDLIELRKKITEKHYNVLLILN